MVCVRKGGRVLCPYPPVGDDIVSFVTPRYLFFFQYLTQLFDAHARQHGAFLDGLDKAAGLKIPALGFAWRQIRLCLGLNQKGEKQK